jgi:hypothetical protein
LAETVKRFAAETPEHVEQKEFMPLLRRPMPDERHAALIDLARAEE